MDVLRRLKRRMLDIGCEDGRSEGDARFYAYRWGPLSAYALNLRNLTETAQSPMRRPEHVAVSAEIAFGYCSATGVYIIYAQM